MAGVRRLRPGYVEKNLVRSLDFLGRSKGLTTLFARNNMLEAIGALAGLEKLTFVCLGHQRQPRCHSGRRLEPPDRSGGELQPG